MKKYVTLENEPKKTTSVAIDPPYNLLKYVIIYTWIKLSFEVQIYGYNSLIKYICSSNYCNVLL